MRILSTWKIRCRPHGNHRRQSPKCQATYTDNCFRCLTTKSRNFGHPWNSNIHWKIRSSIGDFVVHDEYGAVQEATVAVVAVVPVLADRWTDCIRPVPPFRLHLPRRSNLQPLSSNPPRTLRKSTWFHRSTLPDWAALEFAVRTGFGYALPMVCETIASVLYQHNLSPKNWNWHQFHWTHWSLAEIARSNHVRTHVPMSPNSKTQMCCGWCPRMTVTDRRWYNRPANCYLLRFQWWEPLRHSGRSQNVTATPDRRRRWNLIIQQRNR